MVCAGVADRLHEEHGVELDVAPALVARLAEDGFDEAFGARPLRRHVRRTLEKELTRAILDGRLTDGTRVLARASARTAASRCAVLDAAARRGRAARRLARHMRAAPWSRGAARAALQATSRASAVAAAAAATTTIIGALRASATAATASPITRSSSAMPDGEPENVW